MFSSQIKSNDPCLNYWQGDSNIYQHNTTFLSLNQKKGIDAKTISRFLEEEKAMIAKLNCACRHMEVSFFSYDRHACMYPLITVGCMLFLSFLLVIN